MLAIPIGYITSSINNQYQSFSGIECLIEVILRCNDTSVRLKSHPISFNPCYPGEDFQPQGHMLRDHLYELQTLENGKFKQPVDELPRIIRQTDQQFICSVFCKRFLHNKLMLSQENEHIDASLKSSNALMEKIMEKTAYK